MEGANVQRTREKALYWKSFNPVFKVDLLADFRSRLEIPLYFSENLKGRLPRKVALKGPSSTDFDTWEVLVTTTTDRTSIFGEGWRNFVVAFSLEENDTLIFKYKNNSYFNVRIISGKTSCEKESSRFATVLIPEAQQTDGRNRIKMEIEEDKSVDHSSKGRKDDPVVLSHERDNRTDYEEKKLPEVSDSSGSPYVESRKRSAEALFVLPESVRVKTEYMLTPSQPDRNLFPVQREIAKERAKRIQLFTENSFFVSLSRSHVSCARTKLGITKHWWDMVINSKKNQTVKLFCKGDDRSHLCFCVYDEKNSTATITAGWKMFALENALCEGDCCVFTLSKPWKEGEVIHLEVQIIRANE